MSTMPKTYDPKQAESKWYDYWMKGGYFQAGEDPDKEPFTIVIPPPNVTGNLHIGHALNNTLQDILIRFKRMQGYDALWLPGMDHAGIATQSRVEAKLREEGVSRHELGREKFLDVVWRWKDEYSKNIANQWRKMGLSLDYSRERFTLDEGLSEAVKEVFVKLYEKGLIYRGEYIINWDPVAKTALSDIEVIHKEVQGALYHIRYPLADGSGSVQVATTRPETMLGDTALAVHPDDERYQHLIGKEVVLPLTGRKIPVIADEYVDQEFGTGVVKITPAHDPNDFEVGNRHELPRILVMDESGKMNENAGKYQGMDRFDCRKQVVKDLENEGYLIRVEEHVHSVGHSERSGAVVEPYLSTQWFVAMKPLAQRAIQAQKKGEGVRFVPERFEKIYFNWIENVRDWCISRQLWWGHRIPAWYCGQCSEMTVAREEPKTCPHCGSDQLKQDEDVLDTWFSSGLWPFSTLGWPEETGDLKRYYPTDVLLTGYDIIYFWVARMIFLALEFTDDIPFKNVLFTGLVRDAEGRKMSKSLGNGIDPMEVIDQYGADAMRYMLSTGCTPGNDQRFRFERVEAARNFANKIWNASRFALMHLEGVEEDDLSLTGPFSTADQWILHRLNETVRDVTRLLNRFDFGEAGRVLYNFIWDEFCDWYIEFAKLPLYGEDEEAKRVTRSVLVHVLDQSLKLLHPMMPFITEEIWQHLPVKGESIMIAPWPVEDEQFESAQAVRQMRVLIEIIRSVRNIRAEMDVPAKRQIELLIRPDGDMEETIRKHESAIKKLCGVDRLTIDSGLKRPQKSMTDVVTGAEIFLPLAGMVDVEQTIARLKAELKKLNAEVERVEKKLANPGFVSKAPAEVVGKERKKGEEYKEKREKVLARLKEMEG
ncbi:MULTISPECIES: valine--tRNA ligase [Thermoactinomyces]|uniref:Valine--tRNA ligase n=1 Tax=Thermoactinomyces vulgaris TaxID=2026 RepID=A0ABS0QE97_THEVU|nr:MULTISPECIES: valine--tRNA ligase [Thermoactinomyces]KFZ41176.1 valine--tRNA ligase [Thermoactinomyces sp. Gus2-1]KYQ87647.1 valine--tRNA ligase [Thermoactinomyces sp. AS95]MBA4550204.1 valine--tRNA ligase [Thermoactinomyces vulgaris]MBA4595615.1 valine--tRNA ligase [Thermoactinomyces vulgaris]MBH8585118.1 valine--tRNA ligase [Thermoactinomyces sp. CICC 10520]